MGTQRAAANGWGGSPESCRPEIRHATAKGVAGAPVSIESYCGGERHTRIRTVRNSVGSLRSGWLASHERPALLRSPRQRIRRRNTESARLYDDCSYRLADCGRACRRIRIPDSRWRLRLPVTGNWAGSIRNRSGALDQRPESGTRVSGPDQSDFLHGNLLAEQSADL